MKEAPVRICIPVCVQRASELAKAIERAAQVANMIELRLDCLSEAEREAALRELPAHPGIASVSVILTLRSPDQGGRVTVDYQDRYRFWSSFDNIASDCVLDLELDLVHAFAARGPDGKPPLDWNRVICSHHNFVAVPSDLERIYNHMAATPARVLKIAFAANDATDCLAAFHLLERARHEGREMIAIAMGQAGIATRILGPSRGSFLTYATLDDESATAPGQLSVRELCEVYRIDRIDRETEIIGLMGRPVSHSISPQIHNAAFAAADVNAVYIPFEVRDPANFLQRMVHPRSREIDWQVRGMSVTAPHKSAVMNCLDWIEPAAKEIGAVNTIAVRNNELYGYNTDTDGFIAPLRQACTSLKNVRCAIVGAGGGARAALSALQREGTDVELFARNSKRANLTAQEFKVKCRPLAGASFSEFEIVVNATPLGTRDEYEGETPARAEQLRGVRLAYDLVYNPIETQFLREARAAGCETLGGLEMLIAQAAAQFKIWTGAEPDIEVIRAGALGTLSPKPSSSTNF